MQFYKAVSSFSEKPYNLYIHESTKCGPLHCQDYFEFFLTYTDGIIYHINGRQKILPYGSLVFATTHDTHRLAPTDKNVFKYINLSFPKETLNSLFSYLGAEDKAEMFCNGDDIRMVCLDNYQTERLQSKLKRAMSVEYSEHDEQRYYVLTLISQIFVKHFLNNDDDDNENIPKWLSEICHWLRQDMNFASSLAEVADHANKTKEHFSRTMVRYLHCTPMQYINNIRIKYVASMLENTDITITELCLAAGFFSGAYFNKLFKQKYGMTAEQYRKENNQY